MTTTRRIDKTRKPPRRPPVRTAARTDGPTKSSEAASSDATAIETVPAEIAAALLMPEISADEPLLAGTSTVAMLAAEAPVAAPLLDDAPEISAEPHEAAQAGDAVMAEASPEVPAAETEQAPVNQEPAEAPVTAAGTASEEHGIDEAGIHDASVEAPSVQEPIIQEPVAQDSAILEPAVSESAAEAVAESEPAPVQASGVQASAPVADSAAAPRQSGQEDIPLAAMQGFIEINGRLVAFFQGERQAALAFWKAALTVRSPGDLAQLQAAEMSRAVDAALACWTDLAHRMGRLPAFAAPKARAA